MRKLSQPTRVQLIGLLAKAERELTLTQNRLGKATVELHRAKGTIGAFESGLSELKDKVQALINQQFRMRGGSYQKGGVFFGVEGEK